MRVSRLMVGLGLAAGAMSARQADAQINTSFSTSGIFYIAGVSQGSSVAFGDIVLTYNGVTTNAFVTTPSNTNLGEITASCVGGGTGCSLSSLPGALTLQVAVTQSVPFASGPALLPTISFGASFPAAAAIGGSQSTVTGVTSTTPIVFVDLPSTTAVSYQFSNVNYDIVPPSTNLGVTSLQGRVDADVNFTGQAVTPEPASLVLMASGLAGLVGVGLRRRRSA